MDKKVRKEIKDKIEEVQTEINKCIKLLEFHGHDPDPDIVTNCKNKLKYWNFRLRKLNSFL